MNRTKAKDKTKNQLTHGVAELRQRIAELEELETQHNQAEETLRQSAEKYRTILESIEEGYFEVNWPGTSRFSTKPYAGFMGALVMS